MVDNIKLFVLRHDQRRCQRYRKQPHDRQQQPRLRPTNPPNSYDDPFDGEGEFDYDSDEDVPIDTHRNPNQAMGRDLIDVASNAVSQCPVENGVIRTVWGAVAAGPLIAGNYKQKSLELS